MDDIRRMLDRLPELSDAELNELEDGIVAEFGNVEQQEISRETVAEMTFLADSVESVRAERGKREQEKSELAAEASEAASRVTSQVSADEDEDGGDGDDGSEPPEEFAAGAVTAAMEGEDEEESMAEDAAEDEAAEVVGDVVEGIAEELPADMTPEEADAVDEAIRSAVDDVVDEAVGGVPVEGEAPVEGEMPVEGGEEEEEEVPVFSAGGSSVSEAAVVEDGQAGDAARVPGVSMIESVEAPMGDTTAGPTTFSAPADRLPAAREVVPSTPISLVAGGDIPGITAGSELSGGKGLAEAMSLRLHTLRRASGGRGDQVVVASLMASFPEERTLRGNELDSNSEKISAVTRPSAVVASGGWCAPLPVNYDIFDIGGSTATPLKDAMPVFNADRGGVRFIKPPVLDDYVGAVNIWTNQNDIDAADPAIDPPVRKQCLTVKCAEEDEVYLDAITMCMCFGNLQTRAFPELIDRHNQLALVEAARFAEIYIMNKIKDQSTAVVLPSVLGAVRDILISVERAAVAYRHKHRLDPALPLRFIAPQWVGAMIRSDLTAQLPGDGMETTFNIGDSTINSFFEQRNIRPVWTLDGVGNLPTVTDYPDTVEWALFAEGTFTLLDGGTLDIGLIRDMDLVSTNDYCMFTEQFMAVAKTGLDSLWVTQSLNVNGGSAGTLDVAAVDY